jgi:hypothetical protein
MGETGMWKIVAVSCLTALSLAAFASTPRESTEPSAVVAPATPSDVFEMSKAEIRSAAGKALAGDGDSAWALSLYFANNRDESRASLWAKIAVENGSPYATISVGYDALTSNDPCEQTRGIYLIHRALNMPASFQNRAGFVQEANRVQEKLRRLGKLDCSNFSAR